MDRKAPRLTTKRKVFGYESRELDEATAEPLARFERLQRLGPRGGHQTGWRLVVLGQNRGQVWTSLRSAVEHAQDCLDRAFARPVRTLHQIADDEAEARQAAIVAEEDARIARARRSWRLTSDEIDTIEAPMCPTVNRCEDPDAPTSIHCQTATSGTRAGLPTRGLHALTWSARQRLMRGLRSGKVQMMTPPPASTRDGELLERARRGDQLAALQAVTRGRRTGDRALIMAASWWFVEVHPRACSRFEGIVCGPGASVVRRIGARRPVDPRLVRYLHRAASMDWDAEIEGAA